MVVYKNMYDDQAVKSSFNRNIPKSLEESYVYCFSDIYSEIPLYSHRGYSSVVEHLTADQEVPGSNPGAPSFSLLGTCILSIKVVNESGRRILCTD